MIETSDYVFINATDGVTKTPKLVHVDGGTYQVLGQNQHTLFIQRNELVKRTTADKVAVAPPSTRLQPIPPESASKIPIQNKNFKGTPRLFHGLLNHCLKDDSQLKFLFNWSRYNEGIWEPGKRCRKKRFLVVFLVCVGQ